MSRFPPIQFLRTRLRRRGATLVELAIVLVVVGILMGGALIPMRTLEERRQLREETRRMESVRDAIVGYAFRHRTKARVIKFVPWFGPRFEWAFHLPAGRPYLPCPDVNGDGFEDRVPEGPRGFMQGMEVKPDLTVTVTIGSFRGEKFLSVMSNTAVNYQAQLYGECQASRGTVPWRTLGVEPSDGWGNRHTYFADPVFSNAIFGFDRQTIADLYDPRVPDAPGFDEPTQRAYKTVNGLIWAPPIPTAPPGRSGFGHYQQEAGCPAAICDSDNCGSYQYRPRFAEGATIRRCAWRMGAGDRIFKAGAVTKSEIFSETPGGKYFPAGGVTDGLPLVLVSHGPNGRFAVNHWATLNSPTMVCNLAWGNLEELEEGFNELGGFRIPLEERALLYEAVNGARIPDHQHQVHCTALNGNDGIDFRGEFVFNTSHFVWRPPGTGDKSDFDDLLLWMTRDELSVAIPGTIPPLPRMVIGYFPE